MGNTDLVSQITTSHLPGFLHSSQKDGLNNPTEQSNDETSFGEDEIRSFLFIRELIKSTTITRRHWKLYVHHGKIPQKYNIGMITKSGCNFVVKNKSIHLRQM
jgi:hypothetical protein